MNRYETNMKRIFDHQSQDYYFRLYQNNFTYIIRPKERLEKFFDDKQVISCCQQIRLATCFELKKKNFKLYGPFFFMDGVQLPQG